MYQGLKTDPDLEANGVINIYDGFRVTLARAGGNNKKFARVLEAKSRPYKRAVDTETLRNDIALLILKETYAEAVIKLWEVEVDGKWKKGIADPDTGDIMQFKPENVLKVLVHPKLGDLWAEFVKQATKINLYLEQIREDDSGN